MLSDSHSRAAITARAVELLVDLGAEQIIHLGDIETESVIDSLVGIEDADGQPIPMHIVFGNCDWQWENLARYARQLDLNVAHPVGRLEFDGKVLVFLHGHLTQHVENAVDEQVDWLCHGHTHLKRDESIGKTRIINPGALFRAAEYSVAILDTMSDDLAFYTVEKD